MGKLHGQALENALEKRKQHKEDRISRRMTLRKAAKVIGKKMGKTVEEYVQWEGGEDICPHEEMMTEWLGFYPKFFIDRCTKCTLHNNIRSIDDDDAIKDYMRTNPRAFEPLESEWNSNESTRR